MAKISLLNLYSKYIVGTPRKALVLDTTIYIGTLKPGVQSSLSLSSSKVHCTSKVIKHIYDEKPPLHVPLIIKHLCQTIKYPDRVYKNKVYKNNKRIKTRKGDFLFTKKVRNNLYLSVVQKEKDQNDVNWLVSAWILRKSDYLKYSRLLWKF